MNLHESQSEGGEALLREAHARLRPKQGRLRGVEVFKTTPVKFNLAKVSAAAADDSA